MPASAWARRAKCPMAIRKAIEQAKKNLIHLNLKGTTIPHQVLGLYGSGASASEAPRPMARELLPAARCAPSWKWRVYPNVLTKSIGTSEPAQRDYKPPSMRLLRLKRCGPRSRKLRSKTVEELGR